MSKKFSREVLLRFEHADSEGIMFYANIYRLAHEVYEDFVREMGFTYGSWFQNPQWGVPVRKSECEYFSPLLPGQSYDVEVSISSLSESTFTSSYLFTSNAKKFAEVKLVHVFVDRKSRSTTKVPSEVRGRFESYQSESGRAQ